jgi:uncharacterized alpha-E superfamily protein
MLSRTADHLFWMARYTERAENTARMLDVNYQTSLLPQSLEAAEQGWKGLLSICELTSDYTARYGAVTARGVMEFMVTDARNGSSIRNCLMAARENARAVRGTLTTEVWETQNQTWLEFQRMVSGGSFLKDPSAAFEWVKFRSHLSRGVTVGTMLQDDAFHFLRIGSFLERADNTARLLDVKFHAVESEFYGGPHGIGARIPSLSVVGSAPTASPSWSQNQSQSQSQSQSEAQPRSPASANSLRQFSHAADSGDRAGDAVANAVANAVDGGNGERHIEFDFYHWSAILRSVSGFEVYRKVYRDVIRPEKVAELLILRADMPRSLAACMHEVLLNLRMIANEQSSDTVRCAGRLRADLQYGRIDEILATGLHAYLIQFLDRVGTLGVGISRDFLVPMES